MMIYDGCGSFVALSGPTTAACEPATTLSELFGTRGLSCDFLGSRSRTEISASFLSPDPTTPDTTVTPTNSFQ